MTKTKDQIPEDIKALSFEDALKVLEDIVRRLESGDVSLEDSIEIYTRGTWLKLHCESKLKDAEARIEKITFDKDDGATVEDFDIK